MNELLFIAHVFWVSGFAFLCRKKSVTQQTVLMVMYAVLGNVMVLKQMKLFGLIVTTSDVYAVGVILVLNYIREAYDDDAVHQAMSYSFFALFILALAAYFQLQYTAATPDEISQAYIYIMEKFPRIVMVSAVVYFMVQYLDNCLFSWLKYVCNDRYFVVRIATSLLFSQILDTVLFTIGGLYDVATSLWDIIFFSSMVKITCSSFVIIQIAVSHGLSKLGEQYRSKQ